jgi:hypothetical protein
MDVAFCYFHRDSLSLCSSSGMPADPVTEHEELPQRCQCSDEQQKVELTIHETIIVMHARPPIVGG